MDQLVEARLHYGHKEGMLNPHMRPYIFGKRLGVLLFDLDKTVPLLDKALNVTAEIAYRNGIVLFVHQSRESGYIVEEAAKDCGEYAFCCRWRTAILTNAKDTFGSVVRLPDLLIMFSVVQKINQLHDAAKAAANMLIPTIGICDTNADPTLITYPVPGNDDSPQSIELYAQLFKTAVQKGKAKRAEVLEKQGEDYYYKSLEVD